MRKSFIVLSLTITILTSVVGLGQNLSQPIKGQVISLKEQSHIEGAQVRLFPMSVSRQVLSKPIQETKTDKDGHFQFCIPDTVAGSMKNFFVAAIKEGFATGLGAGDPSKPIIVELDEPWSLKGIVVDSQGEPVKKAEISLANFLVEGKNGSFCWASEMAEAAGLAACTDAKGQFRVDNLPYHSKIVIEADKTGMGIAYSPFITPVKTPADTDVKLTLYPQAHLAGIVYKKADRSPIASASTSIYPADTSSRGIPLNVMHTTTDAQGRFSFDRLAPGKYILCSGLPEGCSVQQTIDIQAGQTIDNYVLEMALESTKK